jgi:GNAT superfamily N-acetyltransferase
MTQIAFREAAPADADLIANLHAESWRHAYRGIFPDTFLDRQAGDERRHYWHARLADLATKDSLVLLAEANGSPAGFVCVETQSEPEWGAFVDNLHVLPRHQGQGIGKRLAAAAAEWAGARGKRRMYLWAYEQNKDARGFDESQGWKAVEQVIKGIPGGGARPVVRYVLNLAPEANRPVIGAQDSQARR